MQNHTEKCWNLLFCIFEATWESAWSLIIKFNRSQKHVDRSLLCKCCVFPQLLPWMTSQRLKQTSVGICPAAKCCFFRKARVSFRFSDLSVYKTDTDNEIWKRDKLEHTRKRKRWQKERMDAVLPASAHICLRLTARPTSSHMKTAERGFPLSWSMDLCGQRSLWEMSSINFNWAPLALMTSTLLVCTCVCVSVCVCARVYVCTCAPPETGRSYTDDENTAKAVIECSVRWTGGGVGHCDI